MMKAPLSLVSVKVTADSHSGLTARICCTVESCGCRPTVSEVRSQCALGNQGLNVADALVARAFELFECQPCAAVGQVELLDTAAGVPLRLESRQHAGDLVEVDLIRTLVRAGVRRER